MKIWKYFVLCCCICFAFPVLADDIASECEGPYKGKKIAPEQLKEILKQHKELLEEKNYITKEYTKDNRYANLCGANLKGADLKGANLERVYFEGANLDEANLEGAYLSSAELKKADLYEANLKGANLQLANLKGAFLIKANLEGAYLAGANLEGAKLPLAELKKANLNSANLKTANLKKSNFEGANFKRANLEEANLEEAILINTNLLGANLTNTNLSYANLTKANLKNAILKNSYFLGVNLDKADFFPKSNSYPDPISFSTTKNLLHSNYYNPEYGAPVIQKLLADYKKLGIRHMERLLTYMMKKEQRKADMTKEWGWDKIGAIANLVLFEFPSKYGYKPQFALTILIFSIFIFSFFYWVGLKLGMQVKVAWEPILLTTKRKNLTTTIKLPYFYYTIQLKNPKQSWWYSELKLIRLALHISLNSAFKIGWKGLDFGTWMKKLQKREYHLETPNAWIKSICTVQSLLGIYLVALWFATQFGRPFDY
ncbi:pentapeptide repeat-containing protein [Candidatus Halobeggiatoa sp. HSG11]|nr:pentapeptide repeat-containing protein [Candidatus Halobeggiatoa sp. HSG11]